jgi:DNA polymerase-3 subunit gamma/tau
MFEIAGDMESRSIAFDSALIELGTILHRVALAQLAIDVLPEETPERERVVALAQRFDAESVQLHYQISIHARQDLPLAPDEYAGFTMALMRMLAFAPEGGDTTHSAGGQTPQSSVRPIRPAPLQAVKSNAPAALSRDAAAAPNALRATKASPAKISATTTAATTNAAAMTTTAVTNASTPTASATIVSTPAAAAAKVSAQADWPTLVRSLRMSGVAKQLAERSELLSRDNDKYILRVGADSRSLVQPMYIDKIKAALCEALGRQIRLDVEVGQTSGASVAAIAQNDKRARHEQASNQMNNDPFVRELMNSLDATIESVQPVQQGPQQ